MCCPVATDDEFAEQHFTILQQANGSSPIRFKSFYNSLTELFNVRLYYCNESLYVPLRTVTYTIRFEISLSVTVVDFEWIKLGMIS